jgi:transcriptional regulator with XRE-family HTH domain
MNDRLSQFLSTEQLTPTRFADEIDVQRSGISHILSGRNKPGYDFLEKFIKRFPAVNIEWLITGRGKMYKEMNMPTLFPTLTEPPATERMAITAEETPIITKEEPPTAARQPVVKENGSKIIEKVIVFYMDKTFEKYDNLII